MKSFFFVTSLWTLRPRATSSWPFVTSSWPHVALAVSTFLSGRPSWFLSGQRRVVFPRTLLIWPCLQVRPSRSDLSRFSVSAVTKPLRNLIIACCTSGTYTFAAANLYLSPGNVFPPQSARRFRRQLSDWPPTRVVELSHENPTKPYFLTALYGNPSPPPSAPIALVALCSGRLPLHSDISRDHL